MWRCEHPLHQVHPESDILNADSLNRLGYTVTQVKLSSLSLLKLGMTKPPLWPQQCSSRLRLPGLPQINFTKTSQNIYKIFASRIINQTACRDVNEMSMPPSATMCHVLSHTVILSSGSVRTKTTKQLSPAKHSLNVFELTGRSPSRRGRSDSR